MQNFFLGFSIFRFMKKSINRKSFSGQGRTKNLCVFVRTLFLTKCCLSVFKAVWKYSQFLKVRKVVPLTTEWKEITLKNIKEWTQVLHKKRISYSNCVTTGCWNWVWREHIFIKSSSVMMPKNKKINSDLFVWVLIRE